MFMFTLESAFKRYNTPACKTCISRHLCTQSKNGRYIDRSEYANIVEENAKRVHQNPDYYRKRQQITEHMFGTMKRQRGFTFTLVRGKDNVPGEVGLMFIAYNLSRCISVLGAEKLIKALRERCLSCFLRIYRLFLSHFKQVLEKSKSLHKSNYANFYPLNGSLFKSYELSLMLK